MKITFSEETNKIQIDDNLNSKTFINGVMLFCFSLIGIVHVFDVFINGANYSNVSLMLLGLGSLAYFIFTLVKTVTKSDLEVSEIDSINRTMIFSKKLFYFKLKNGKFRSLEELKKEEQITATLNLMQSHNIPFNKVASPLNFLKYGKVVKQLISNK